MVTIIIYGNKKDKQIKDSLLRLLAPRYQVNYISESALCSEKPLVKGTPINIIETSSVGKIKIKNAILILKDNAKISSIKFVDKSINAIINADNTKNSERLTKAIKNVYTCGFSSKDYVTFSSREQDNANVSLQRSIKLINGNFCEPMEIPCDIPSNIDDYSILATVLTMILLDSVTENKLSLK